MFARRYVCKPRRNMVVAARSTYRGALGVRRNADAIDDRLATACWHRPEWQVTGRYRSAQRLPMAHWLRQQGAPQSRPPPHAGNVGGFTGLSPIRSSRSADAARFERPVLPARTNMLSPSPTNCPFSTAMEVEMSIARRTRRCRGLSRRDCRNRPRYEAIVTRPGPEARIGVPLGVRKSSPPMQGRAAG